MNDERDLESIGRQLRTVLPPLEGTYPGRDLWPEMLRRMDEKPLRFGWSEAAVAAAIATGIGAFPELLPFLLFHL